MAWRRACGAIIMGLGAAALLATIAGATVLAVSIVKSGDLPATPPVLATGAAGGVLGGIVVLLLGRLIYGHWRRAAPIANFTADVTRMVGLAIAFGLGAMLVFLLATGLEKEDAVAAIVLGIGTVAGLGLAYVGNNLRRGGRSYLD
ncbi:MAG: hypothetical protein R3C46_15115 [Hyphomonadaceae bacterium]